MKVLRTSAFTGVKHEMEIDISPPEFEKALLLYHHGALLQDAFPTLNPDEREFIKTGITPQEWEDLFGDDE